MAKMFELKAMKRSSVMAMHGRHAVDGEHHVGALDHQQRQKHRRDAPAAVLVHEEAVAVLAMVAVRDRQEPPGDPQHDVVFRVDVDAAVPGQLVAGVDRETARRCGMTQSKRWINSMPARMNASRMTIAPRMPQNSTRYWYIRGMWKKRKITTKTKMLSIDNAFSTA